MKTTWAKLIKDKMNMLDDVFDCVCVQPHFGNPDSQLGPQFVDLDHPLLSEEFSIYEEKRLCFMAWGKRNVYFPSHSLEPNCVDFVPRNPSKRVHC